MQPGLYLPTLSCHTGLLVACLALGSTTWLRPPCYSDVIRSRAERPTFCSNKVPQVYLITARLCYVSRVSVRLAFSQQVHCETCTLAILCSAPKPEELESQSMDSRGNQDGNERLS